MQPRGTGVRFKTLSRHEPVTYNLVPRSPTVSHFDIPPFSNRLRPRPHESGYFSISYPESSGFLVSGATPGRLWGHRILLPQDFCGKTMETVSEQPIKKIEFFRCPQSLPGVAPLTKKPEDSGYEIGYF